MVREKKKKEMEKSYQDPDAFSHNAGRQRSRTSRYQEIKNTGAHAHQRDTARRWMRKDNAFEEKMVGGRRRMEGDVEEDGRSGRFFFDWGENG